MQIDPNNQYKQSDLPAEVFNAGSGAGGNIVNYNGQAVQVYNNGNGTRKLVPQGDWASYQSGQSAKQASSDYQAAIGTAVTGLQQAGTNLDTQYGDLLTKVLGQGTVAMNTVTTGENNLLASRGITNNSPLYSSQMGSAQLPVQVANQAASSNLGYTQAGLKLNLANSIASLQGGAAGTMANLPLSYGSLALAQAANVANISLMGSQAAQAGVAAKYITIPGVGVVNLSNGQFVGGQTNNNLNSGGYQVLKVQ